MSMKKIYIAIAAVLFAAASVATVFAVRSHNRMDDFFRANVDALSRYESPSEDEKRLKMVECVCADGKKGKTLKCTEDGDLEKCTESQQGSNACYKVSIVNGGLVLCTNS